MPSKPTDPYDRANRFRQTFLRAVSEDDIAQVAAKLVDQAKAGDRIAMRYLLDRVLGTVAVEDWPSEAGAAVTANFRRMAAGG